MSDYSQNRFENRIIELIGFLNGINFKNNENSCYINNFIYELQCYLNEPKQNKELLKDQECKKDELEEQYAK